jgi:hypothetical protein
MRATAAAASPRPHHPHRRWTQLFYRHYFSSGINIMKLYLAQEVRDGGRPRPHTLSGPGANPEHTLSFDISGGKGCAGYSSATQTTQSSPSSALCDGAWASRTVQVNRQRTRVLSRNNFSSFSMTIPVSMFRCFNSCCYARGHAFVCTSVCTMYNV